ncbi:major facilitator superfamily domain-containing protein [Syncephalis plumigaleata]|nr:major facilitator superfamily domain-containing protein [Syncephalis plumigaleata]
MAKLNQLVSLACAVLGMLAAGTVNTFSLFGPQLARQLDYTQLQLSQVAAAANVAHYLSAPLVGAYVDRVGPHRSSFFGALLLFSGYYGMAMMCDNELFTTSYALAMVFAAMTGIGTTIACAVALLTVAHRLPAIYRGTAFGVVLGVFGLSACLFALLHGSSISYEVDYSTKDQLPPSSTAAASSSPHDFLQLLAGLCGTFSLLVSLQPSWTGWLTNTDDSAPGPSPAPSIRPEDIGYGGTLPDIFIEESPSRSHSRSNSASSHQSGLSVSSLMEPQRPSTPYLDLENHNAYEEVPVVQTSLLLPPPPPPLLPPSPSPSILVNEGDSFPFYDNLETTTSWTTLLTDKDFIALWLIKCLAVGVGIIMDSSLFATVSAQVAAFGAASGAGQLVVGCLSDHAVNTARLHRLCVLAMFIAQLGGFFAMNATTLFVISIANGLAFGALDVLLPTLASEMWDSTLVGRSIGWLALAPAFGGQLFITLFGLVFDWHQSSSSMTSTTCEGSACYQDIFMFTSIACLASLVVSILLYRRRTQQAAIYLCVNS